jgi:hypothetical protein
MTHVSDVLDNFVIEEDEEQVEADQAESEE